MARKKLAAPSAPFWLVTFSDMMSLLVCFFVLLISFSTMNQKRFYEMSGSMKDAFGIDQTTLLTKIIELDGVPFMHQNRTLVPMPMAVVAAALQKEDSNPTCGDEEEGLTPGAPDRRRWELADRGLQGEQNSPSGTEGAPGPTDRSGPAADFARRVGAPMVGAAENGPAALDRPDADQADPISTPAAVAAPPGDALGSSRAETGTGPMTTDGAQVAKPKTETEPAETEAAERSARTAGEIAKQLNAVLGPEIAQGLLSVERRLGEVIITFPSAATFESGSDAIAPTMLSAIDRVAGVLAEAPGDVAVNGHTDPVPIATARFPSNWELSTARAIVVLRRLELTARLDRTRLSVMGYADTRPIAANDSAENRSRNRRVEIVLRQP